MANFADFSDKSRLGVEWAAGGEQSSAAAGLTRGSDVTSLKPTLTRRSMGELHLNDQEQWEYRRLVFRIGPDQTTAETSPDFDEVREMMDRPEPAQPAGWRLISVHYDDVQDDECRFQVVLKRPRAEAQSPAPARQQPSAPPLLRYRRKAA